MIKAEPQKFWRNGYVNPRQTWMIPPRYNLYNPYKLPRMPFNPYQAPRIPFTRIPFPRIPFNRRPVNYPPQRFSPSNNNNAESNVIWSSQWTEWLPASKVNWEALKKRTFVRENLQSLSPKSFAGNQTYGAINGYQGMVKENFSGILPSNGWSDNT